MLNSIFKDYKNWLEIMLNKTKFKEITWLWVKELIKFSDEKLFNLYIQLNNWKKQLSINSGLNDLFTIIFLVKYEKLIKSNINKYVNNSIIRYDINDFFWKFISIFIRKLWFSKIWKRSKTLKTTLERFLEWWKINISSLVIWTSRISWEKYINEENEKKMWIKKLRENFKEEFNKVKDNFINYETDFNLIKNDYDSVTTNLNTKYKFKLLINYIQELINNWNIKIENNKLNTLFDELKHNKITKEWIKILRKNIIKNNKKVSKTIQNILEN